MSTRGNVGRATKGSWKDKEDNFDSGDRVMLRYPAELYGFCGRKARKGWDGRTIHNQKKFVRIERL
jgi:hypothetical protein